jgi:hypothetical protein
MQVKISNRKIIPLALLGFFLLSCKKDKLDGDSSILTGTWEWTETYKVPNLCDADSMWNYTKIDSSYTDNTYSLEFIEKGKVKFIHNDGIINTNRIVFSSKDEIANSTFQFRFIIHLNNKSDNTMEVLVGSDSLLVNDFPKDTDEPCEELFNYFVK